MYSEHFRADSRLPAQPFDLLARYYDWEHADFLADLSLYLGYAERVGGPVFEAACGSGRLLFPLAEAGYEVVGLDASTAMLDLARARLDARPALRAQVTLRQGDLRALEAEGEYGLVILALDSLGLLVERQDQLHALDALRGLLPRRGLLIVDVANGNLRGGEAAEETALQKVGATADGRSITKWVWRRTDHAEQLDRLLQVYDECGADGVVRRTSVELAVRYFTRFELELLLERAGLEIEALFGDYELTPYEATSSRLLAVAHAR